MLKQTTLLTLALTLLSGAALAGSDGADNARAMRERMGTQTTFERSADQPAARSEQDAATPAPEGASKTPAASLRRTDYK